MELLDSPLDDLAVPAAQLLLGAVMIVIDRPGRGQDAEIPEERPGADEGERAPSSLAPREKDRERSAETDRDVPQGTRAESSRIE